MSAATAATSVQGQLLADLEEAVREFPAAICDIKDLRGEMHYLVCNFPGLEVKALYDVVSRYTDTTIVTEPAGNGQDRHVIKSKHTAALKVWRMSWLTMRNVLAVLVALASLTNLLFSSPFIAHLLQLILPSALAATFGGVNATTPPAETSNTTTSTSSSSSKPATKGGFSIF